MSTKSVVLLDFDNIFLGLWKLDRDLALRFGQTPLEWLSLLADRHLTLDRRRWLVSRCYLNPAGWVPSAAEASGRLYLSRFRPGLVRAGFEVVDCPGLTGEGKNAADIRIVIDALDLLRSDCRYEEFVIASGDADFTPLLHRLRAADRRIAVMAPSNAAPAYTSLADRIVGFEALEGLLRPEPMIPSDAPMVNGDDRKVEGSLRDYIRDRLASSVAPINLSSLAQDVGKRFPGARESGSFGPGSFTAVLKRLEISTLQISPYFVWDVDRHTPPQDGANAMVPSESKVDQILTALETPRLSTDTWPRVFDVLERYAANHVYSMTEATRWSRDTLVAEGHMIGRGIVNYVVRGTQLGGAPLETDPPPTARQIGLAFCTSLLETAPRLGIDVTPQIEIDLAARFGIDLVGMSGDATAAA
ncbi:MAG: NYN domain-containing protein [Pseudomonadota bacterium]